LSFATTKYIYTFDQLQNQPIMKNIIFSLIFLTILSSLNTFAQTNNSTDTLRYGSLKVFLDCFFCDEAHFRRQISFINYVRDTKEADVHVLVTSERTGSEGRAYTFTFIGQNEFQDMNDTLVFIRLPDDTQEMIREGQIRTLKLGLIRYVARTPVAPQINIDYSIPSTNQLVEDKWKSWVFSTGISTDFRGEKSNSEYSIFGRVSAQKVTPDWKIDMDYFSRINEEKYITEDEGTIYGTRQSHYFNFLVVKSINDHWSVGASSDISSSLYRNYKLSLSLFPGIEYDLFPYSESTRRQLRILYSAGYKFNRYNDTTIYFKTQESLLGQQLDVAFEVTQKWGSIEASLNWMNYFYDWSKNNLTFVNEVRIRIAKGLELDIDFGISLVQNQLNLVKEEVSTEDILLQIKELETSYQYEFDIGISYTFGAIYNNVVNPRFGNGRRFYFY